MRAIRTLLFALFILADLAVIGLFGVGYAAAYLHPERFWWTGIVAVGLPAIALALLALFPVALAARRRARPLFWIHLAALALAFVRFDDALMRPVRSAPAPSDGDLTLMTLNAPRGPETEEAARTVSRIVRRYAPDAIGLQESNVFTSARMPNRLRAHAKFAALVDSLDYRAPIPTLGPPHGRWTWWRQPFIGRLPIHEQEQIVLRHPTIEAPTAYALRTEFSWQGRRAVHYNLHLYSYGRRKPWEQREIAWLDLDYWRPFLRQARNGYRIRAWQAEQIRARIEAETLPVLISGDFNGTVHNWSYRHLARGFRDAFEEAGQGSGATYHVDHPLVRIDHILVGPEWEAVWATAVPSIRPVSDHRPLVARIRWRDER